MKRLEIGQVACVVENGLRVRKVIIMKDTGSFCTVCFHDNRNAAMLVRKSRIFTTMKEAEESIQRNKMIHPAEDSIARKHPTPWD